MFPEFSFMSVLNAASLILLYVCLSFGLWLEASGNLDLEEREKQIWAMIVCPLFSRVSSEMLSTCG